MTSHKNDDDKLRNFLFDNLYGQVVEVAFKDGRVIDGILGERLNDNVLRLKLARTLHGDKALLKLGQSVEVSLMEMVYISSKMVNIQEACTSSASSTCFKTDADISGSTNAKLPERQLHRWSEDGDAKDLLTGLEDLPNGPRWDQFAANQKLFGITSSFDENLYTTPLDPESRKKYGAEAERIAHEIESEGASSSHASISAIHLAEERGITVHDSQINEEDRYGAVLRNHTINNQDNNGSPIGTNPTASPPFLSLPEARKSRGSLIDSPVDVDALAAAKVEVQNVTRTINRRLSQINMDQYSNPHPINDAKTLPGNVVGKPSVEFGTVKSYSQKHHNEAQPATINSETTRLTQSKLNPSAADFVPEPTPMLNEQFPSQPPFPTDPYYDYTLYSQYQLPPDPYYGYYPTNQYNYPLQFMNDPAYTEYTFNTNMNDPHHTMPPYSSHKFRPKDNNNSCSF